MFCKRISGAVDVIATRKQSRHFGNLADAWLRWVRPDCFIYVTTLTFCRVEQNLAHAYCSTHKFTAKFSPWSKFPRRIRFACVSKSITTSDLCAHIEWIFSFLQSIQFCMWRQISSRAMYQRLHAVNIKIDAQTIGLCDFVVSHMLRATRTKKEREKHVTANYDNKLQNLTPDQWTCPMLNCSSYIFDWLTFCATPNFPHSISSFNDFPFRMGAFFVTAVHSFASNMANQHVLNCRLRREKKNLYFEFIFNYFCGDKTE